MRGGADGVWGEGLMGVWGEGLMGCEGRADGV